MKRTRIKICGLTERTNLDMVIAAGADAIGLVFYPPSPRFVCAAHAAELIARLPPFVTVTGLFVNPTEQELMEVVRQVPLQLLQFHGDETPAQCAALAAAAGLPFVKAFRVRPDTRPEDLLQSDSAFRSESRLCHGLLLDTHVEGYGGSGKVFDWSLVPKELAPRVVLSGGLSVQNVAGAVEQLRPFAVDISSGVERSKGMKDEEKVRAFIEQVRIADQTATA